MLGGQEDGPPQHVLVVEDDEQVRAFVRDYLEASHFRVSVAANGGEVDMALAQDKVDLVVLDRMLPGESGLDICKRLFSRNIPVIMLTALSQEGQRIAGLEAGADDYVGKPFSLRELLARIKAVLRRRAGPLSEAGGIRGFRFAGWHLDLTTRKLFDRSGARIYLRGAETNLLQVLCENPGRVLTREEIIRLIHSDEHVNSARSVDIVVSRLRRRLEEDPKDPSLILTLRSAGYVFTPEVVVT